MEPGGREKKGIYLGEREYEQIRKQRGCVLHQIESGRGIRRVYLQNVRDELLIYSVAG